MSIKSRFVLVVRYQILQANVNLFHTVESDVRGVARKMWSSPNIPTVVLTILCELGIGIGPSWGKTFDPCELAQGLANAPGISQDQIADWVCLARYESEYNSSAVGTLNWDGSKDLGIFQISEKYWCEWGKPGKACRQRCEDFLDNDLEDDIKCVRKIHKEHTKLSGNGFNAWQVF
eukprot:maker-scaffold23_size669530-snap-gene-3.11 protein:Tk11068 transcript:maker-scaffold23_size669530-snap-gene-3.11-mRNA-1 annotation:"GA28499"